MVTWSGVQFHVLWMRLRVSGDPMVPHPLNVIQYARSSYYYDNMFIICLFFWVCVKL